MWQERVINEMVWHTRQSQTGIFFNLSKGKLWHCVTFKFFKLKKIKIDPEFDDNWLPLNELTFAQLIFVSSLLLIHMHQWNWNLGEHIIFRCSSFGRKKRSSNERNKFESAIDPEFFRIYTYYRFDATLRFGALK